MSNESPNNQVGKTFQEHLKKGSTAKKWIILVLALIYVVSPIDLIPEMFVPFLGWLDDIGVLAFVASIFFRGYRQQKPTAEAPLRP